MIAIPGVPPGWGIVDGQLQIGCFNVSELVDRYGTPLYVYDAECIRSKYGEATRTLPGFSIAYSLKANPSLAICSLLQRLGCWAEVASAGEISIAEAAGFPQEHVIFAGPAKQDWEIRRACDENIGFINVESSRELAFLHKMRAEGNNIPPICIRVNSRAVSPSAQERMAGGPSRFGIDEELIPTILQSHSALLNMSGLHVYRGSQIFDSDEIIRNFEDSVALFAATAQHAQSPFSTLIFGGGFGVPNAGSDRPLDLDKVGGNIASILARIAYPPTRLILELGRFLVASSGVFISRAIDVKRSRGKVFVMTDGGINNFLRPAFMRATHPICVLNRIDEVATLTASIGGPLCTPLDEFASTAEIPETQPGDLIGIMNAGAYGFSMSMHHFLGHVSPAEVIVDNNATHLARPRSSIAQLIQDQMNPTMSDCSTEPL